MDGIEAAFVGVVGKPPELRTAQSGKPWCYFSALVKRGDDATWVKISAFGKAAEMLCKTLEKGDKVYAEGRLSASLWQPDGREPRLSVELAAWKCERLGEIGRKKPKRERQRQNDGQVVSRADRYQQGYAATCEFSDELPI
jgi:single-stranded DNA-binding protein